MEIYVDSQNESERVETEHWNHFKLDPEQVVGSQLTCLVSPGPLHLDIAPPALQLTIFNRIPFFLPELKKGSSCCGIPGSDNVCSRSLISKVNHPRLNYWHPSTDGGLNYDALNQSGVPCNYIHFTQLDSQLQSPVCKISIPQTCQKTHLKDPLYHDLWKWLTHEK